MNTNHQQLPSGIDNFAANRGACYRNTHTAAPVFRCLQETPHEKSWSCR